MESAKVNIRKIVDTYTKVAPEEYALFKTQMVSVRKELRDDEFAAIDKGQGAVQRALYEMPENLQAMLVNNLTEDQLMWFKSLEGGRWFATNFPHFRIPAHV